MKHKITLPILDSQVRELKIGDLVFLSGLLITARDQAHRRINDYINLNKPLPREFSRLKGSAIYHCGPIMKECNSKYEFISGGPTTSQRLDLYANNVISKLGIKLVIGKGGMKNLDIESNTVAYLSFTGGCGAIVNQKIESVIHVEWTDLGLCEAVWFLKVKDLGPLIVTQDVYGDSLNF
ncbi:MAG: FumA C-terminus/TtdB family hydratase beta subunit [Promethearchaeota archaeon]